MFPSLSSIPIYPSSSAAVKMEQRHLSHRKQAQLCVRTCIVCHTLQRRQRSSSRLLWRCCQFVFSFSPFNNPSLARQRRINIQRGPYGKLIYTRNHDALSGNFQAISDPSSSPSTSFTDGSRLPLSTKEISSTEIFAIPLLHSTRPIRHSIRRQWIQQNKHFGNGTPFAWAPDSNIYGVFGE